MEEGYEGLNELTGKGKIGGGIGALLWSRNTGGEERRGWWGGAGNQQGTWPVEVGAGQ
jgi:hypothetical protein